MTLEQLTFRYFGLQQELAIAYRQRPWQTSQINRLADELAGLERQLAASQVLADSAMSGLVAQQA